MKEPIMGSSTVLSSRLQRKRVVYGVAALLCLAGLLLTDISKYLLAQEHVSPSIQAHRTQILSHCQYIKTPAGPPPNFATRSHSDRHVPGTRPVLLKNGKIWTGARDGTEIVYGDVLLDNGIIKGLGIIPASVLSLVEGRDLQIVDVQGAWITPGLVDLHSHIGVHSAPMLAGSSDGNSRKAPILPWLRSIDGLNTHDASYELAIAGGVTTAQVLPGSANNIGGQAFVIKLRPTSDRAVTSKVIEPPYTLNGTNFDHSLTPRWRHMKHACGENPDRLYRQTRMDAVWNFRQAYNEARKIKEAQDQFCAKAEAGLWEQLDDDLPDSLQWESLVDVLRGKVKLSIHCYEAVDLDGIVRLSQEFKFPVASFHHAGETYLVPDLLKKTWGGAPSIALFASNFKKKREAYRGSEFAPRVLAENGIPVVMKSDHPVLNSRYLLYEAQQAHYYGLNPALALASVTSVPAKAAGLGHRVGTVAEGYDADIVVWDSHPLALGATPKQVYIDGVAQLDKPSVSPKPPGYQDLPPVPNFDKEAALTVEYEGVPPLEGRIRRVVGFTNVSTVYVQSPDDGIITALLGDTFAAGDEERRYAILVRDGEIVCMTEGFNFAPCLPKRGTKKELDEIEIVDLAGGSLSPGLTTFGAPLGLVEIRLEASTNDGNVPDILDDSVPALIANISIRAIDGLAFGGRNTLLAYHGGVTTAVTAPSGDRFTRGVSAAFATGARSLLEKGAIVQEETALHVAIDRGNSASVSTQIAALRHLLFTEDNTDAWTRVREGRIPLVVHTDSSDIIASVIILKSSYENLRGASLRVTIAGGAEAHLLAKELAAADISVILTSPRPFPNTWDQRRILPGPPLSEESATAMLLRHGVNVALGVAEESAARNARFDLAWITLESGGNIDKATAIALATTHLERALGVETPSRELVAYSGGGVLEFHSKVVGVLSPKRRLIELF